MKDADEFVIHMGNVSWKELQKEFPEWIRMLFIKYSVCPS